MANKGAPASLGMLNRDQITARLRKGEIFRPETWAADSIGSGSYDLHIAKDFLIDKDGQHPRGSDVRDITLDPGAIAMVSTQEKFCVPWDIVGNMSPKFSLAKKGLLVHTGSIVDPGFGLEKDGAGKWTATEDERVHFYLANVGPDPIHLRAGDQVATIQFHQIIEPKEKKVKKSRERMEKQLFGASHPPNLGLAYFAFVTKTQKQNSERADQMNRRIDELEIKLADVKSGYQQLTFFGIYVLAAALLTIFGAAFLQDAATKVFATDAPWWQNLFFSLVIVFLVGFPIALIVLLRRGDRSKKSA